MWLYLRSIVQQQKALTSSFCLLSVNLYYLSIFLYDDDGNSKDLPTAWIRMVSTVSQVIHMHVTFPETFAKQILLSLFQIEETETALREKSGSQK